MKKKYTISTGISGKGFGPKEGDTHAKIDSPDRRVHYCSSDLSLWSRYATLALLLDEICLH